MSEQTRAVDSRPDAEVAVVRDCVERLRVLTASDNVMVAMATQRVQVILAELLVEVTPDTVDAPWQLTRDAAGPVPGASV